MAEPSRSRALAPDLTAGTPVEVRTGFDRSWSKGFVIVEATDIGYRLRRESDASLLPVIFLPADVRKERKSAMWWF